MSWSPERATARVLRGCDADLLERASVTTPVSEISMALPEPISEDPVRAAYEAGVRAGRESTEREHTEGEAEQRAVALSQLSNGLTTALESLANNRRAVLEELLEETSDLVFMLVRELVGEELELRDEPVRAAIKRALRISPPETDIIIHLHPSASIAAWEIESMAPGRRVRVVEDDRIEISGCVLEAGSSIVDAQLGPALERLRVALSSQLRHGAGLAEAV